MNEERLLVAPPEGKYEDKSTIVPMEQVVASVIHYFVIERRHIRHHTVANDTMIFLEGIGFIGIDRYFQRDVNVALRSMQRFFNCLGC